MRGAERTIKYLPTRNHCHCSKRSRSNGIPSHLLKLATKILPCGMRMRYVNQFLQCIQDVANACDRDGDPGMRPEIMKHS